ncbi:hypothetical protein [Vibrio parahaemolyticus]|uniref:hypothetical protein n=1 Tax=Vibrio parahaemolyticus TaxID=670 RepID=UPI001EEC50BE|nr:hypothetical protein [Vibrio parahaemolyticus]MCG6443629.1 hypothetical protein [Vibrio parahaemolyticus]MCG6455981.1 hypothetical protein [Vibrio parahaemolyticus]HCE1787791.1 hypothetical protein [Vibrio parahaemolyticus]HCE1907103.1 hypothetical protein [Vibrio parahaemolyticus]HCG5135218.1 hypothetical protein [Vibrio parahaemolyticus]
MAKKRNVISELQGQRVLSAKLVSDSKLEIKISNGDIVIFDAYSKNGYDGESMIAQMDTKKNAREKRSSSLIKLKFPCDVELYIDVTIQKSNEKPKESCINKMVSFKVGEKIFHYLNKDPNIALEKFKYQLSARMKLKPFKLPEVGFCVITHFKDDFDIDWADIEMYYHNSFGLFTD